MFTPQAAVGHCRLAVGCALDNTSTWFQGLKHYDEPHNRFQVLRILCILRRYTSDDAGTGTGTCEKISVQCAYHGWTFDGASGAAVDVPRLTTAAAAPPPPSLCATAVPACRHAGLVWVGAHG